MYTADTKTPHQVFELAPLPYAEDALEPVISRETLTVHYGKHHRGYIEKLNKLVEGSELAQLPLDELVRRAARDPSRQDVFVLKDMRAPTNLVVPRYEYLSGTCILIGDDTKSAQASGPMGALATSRVERAG